MAHLVLLSLAVSSVLTTPAAVSVLCVHTQDGFSQLAEDWHSLFERARCSHVFLSHEWMSEWWKHWGAGHKLFIIEVRNADGRLIAIAPFYIRHPKHRGIGARVLAFLASSYVASDHLDILVEPGSESIAIPAIIQCVLRYRHQWDYIELADCDTDSLVFTELRYQCKAAHLREHVTKRPDRPYTPLPPQFNEFLSRLTASVRRNFRRKLRNLQQEGQLEVVCLTHNAEIQKHFADLLHLHRLRSEQIDRDSSLSDRKLVDFHISLLKRLALRPWPRLYFLKVSGQTIASLYGFSIGKRFSLYQSGMHPQWTKLSPGMVMTGCGIQHCIETGHTEFDFLRGTEPYKREWTKYSRNAVTVRLFDRRWKGSAVLFRLRLRDQAAWLKRHLWRPAIRRWQQIVAKSQTVAPSPTSPDHDAASTAAG